MPEQTEATDQTAEKVPPETDTTVDDHLDPGKSETAAAPVLRTDGPTLAEYVARYAARPEPAAPVRVMTAEEIAAEAAAARDERKN